MKKKKTIIAIVLLGVLGIIGATFAYFSTTDTFDNLFHTEIYRLESYEVFEAPDDWKPGDTTPKTFSTKNVGNVDVALRVSFEEQWINALGDNIIPDNPNDRVTTINMSSNYPMKWLKTNENGKYYYYYRTKLKSNEEISSLMDSVTFNEDIRPSSTNDCTENPDTHAQSCRTKIYNYADASYTLTIKIETVEYSHYKEVWGTSLEIGDEADYNLANFVKLSIGNGEVVNDDPDHNARYIGKDPENYVLFNNELWRMVGAFGDRVKIVRNDPIGMYSWDSSPSDINGGYGVNEWSQADIKNELNGDYLNTELTEDTYWYDGSHDQKTGVFDHTKVLKSDAQNLIDDAVWYLGTPNVDLNDGSVISDYYDRYDDYRMTSNAIYVNERSTFTGKRCTEGDYCNDTVERTSTWTGKVGLLYPSDYLYATAGGQYRSRYSCLTSSAYYYGRYTDCYGENWIQSDQYFTNRLISPAANTSNAYNATMFYSSSSVQNDPAYDYYHIKPSVYLKSNVKVDNGSGRKNEPYVISLSE